jgi:hypothetical protein
MGLLAGTMAVLRFLGLLGFVVVVGCSEDGEVRSHSRRVVGADAGMLEMCLVFDTLTLGTGYVRLPRTFTLPSIVLIYTFRI